MAAIMSTDVLLGTTVLGMIYQVQFGAANGSQMLRQEYGSLVNNMTRDLSTNLQSWVGNTRDDIDNNIRRLWSNVKSSSASYQATYIRSSLSDIITDNNDLNVYVFDYDSSTSY